MTDFKQQQNNSAQDLDVINHYINLSENQDSNESAETQSLREQAKQNLLDKGLPNKKHEEWQYTSLEAWKSLKFDKNHQGGYGSFAELASHLPSFDTFKLIFVDGDFNQDLSDDLTQLPTGCKLAIYDENPLLPSGKTVEETFPALFALTSEQTIHIEISEKAVIELPLHIVQVSTHAKIEATGLEIDVAKSAQCKVIQQFVALNETAEKNVFFNNSYAEINVAQNAVCEQFIVQSLSEESFYFNNQVVNQARDSTFKTHYVNLGSVLARQKNTVSFYGENCEAYQSSVALASGNQVVDSRTHTNHNVPHCESYQLHKFVLNDNARGVFNGMIYVAQDAQKTDGNMDNRNLLLSDNAKMDSKPQLEIFADDVLCSHGCTSGQINEKELFYCQARGIRKADAMALITRAFVLEPLDSIENPEIKSWLADLILEKLAGQSL